MASENEPAKLLLPYLQRADELQKHEPLVAYYCRLYAMERGLKIPQSERTKTTNSILVSLMKQLEKAVLRLSDGCDLETLIVILRLLVDLQDKKSLQLGPDDHLHLEGFASNVFAKADKQDRAGRADISTAKTFYAASIFFEILNQFGELQPDLEQKQKYAVWKAADIRKAIKDGRKPLPGPPGGVDDKDPSDTSSTGYDLESTNRQPPDSHPPPHLYDRSNSQNFTNSFPSPPRETQPPPPHSTVPPPSSNTQPPPPTNFSRPSSTIQPPPPSNFSPPSSTMPPPPANHTSDDYQNPTFSQTYHHPSSYPQEPHHQNYPPHDPSYTYPNFQSYPSFSESSLPAAPANYPSSYYQGSDGSSYSPSAARPTDYPANGGQYMAAGGGGNGVVPEPATAPAKSYEYDSSYQPPPEKIAEAHKAARFAVGALAFDDVFVAVDYLKKSLELLTNPSANV